MSSTVFWSRSSTEESSYSYLFAAIPLIPQYGSSSTRYGTSQLDKRRRVPLFGSRAAGYKSVVISDKDLMDVFW